MKNVIEEVKIKNVASVHYKKDNISKITIRKINQNIKSV